jgi:hypothetical protein
MAFSFSMGEYAPQAARERPLRLLIAPAPNAVLSGVCLPTASALPTEESADFGTSTFYGQLSDKPRLACSHTMGVSERKHKKL